LPAAGIGLLQNNFEELLCNAITDPGGRHQEVIGF